MRKTMLVAAGFFIAASVNAQKENEETIQGNGTMVTKEIAVTAFSELKASGVYDLILLQGNKETVKIEADENLQQYFEVHNDGNQLVVEMKKLNHRNLKLKNKLKVYVMFKDLKEMNLSMVGEVHADSPLNFTDLAIKNSGVGKVNLELVANSLTLRNNSVGKVKLSGKAQNAVMINNGVGSLDASSFIVQTMNIDNSGVGGAEVNAEKELIVRDGMLSGVKNKGTALIRKNNKVRV